MTETSTTTMEAQQPFINYRALQASLVEATGTIISFFGKKGSPPPKIRGSQHRQKQIRQRQKPPPQRIPDIKLTKIKIKRKG